MELILDYNRYIELMKEGLIFTHNIYKYKNSLQMQLDGIGVKTNINILSKYNYDLQILNSSELNADTFDCIIEINQDVLGFFPSYIIVTNKNGENRFKFDKKYLSNEYSNIIIRFEGKYDDGIYKNDLTVPEYAFHLSPELNKKKILDNGLCPKSRNRISNYPERIYMFYNVDDYQRILKRFKQNDILNNNERTYVLYNVKLNDNMVIHTDPNFNAGFFTYDNIAPFDIEIIKDNL